jgi:hypothetical protein
MFKVSSKAQALLYPDEFDTVDAAIAYCQGRPDELPFTIYQMVKTVQVGTITVSDPVESAAAVKVAV